MKPYFSRFFIYILLSLSCAFSGFASSLTEIGQELILDKLGNSASEIELKFDARSKATISNIAGKSVQRSELSYFAPEYSSFRISIIMENDEVFELFGKYKAFANVPITTKSMKSGSIITESDVISVKTPLSRVKSGYVTSISDIVGMQVKRPISSGVLVKHADVIRPQIVLKGDSVSIVYKKANIKLSTSGIAMQPGALGENIKVKNESTEAVINVTVKGRNLVEVGG